VLAIKTRFESGPVTADLTTTVVHSSKLLINDVKPDHSLYRPIAKNFVFFRFKITEELSLLLVKLETYIESPGNVLK